MFDTFLLITDASITDWLQTFFSAATLLISTALGIATLIFLIKNFSEQLKVNQAQLQLLEIERRRASREIRPDISLDFVRIEDKDFSASDTGVHSPSLITKAYKLSISNNFASDICFEYYDLPPHGCYSEELKPGRRLPFKGTELNIILYIQFAKIDTYGLNYSIKLRVHCRDEDGRGIHKDFIVEHDKVSVTSYNEDGMHPSVNTCNFFDKINFPYKAKDTIRPKPYPWMPKFSTQESKKTTLRMFPMYTFYGEQFNWIMQNTDTLGWPLEPFK